VSVEFKYRCRDCDQEFPAGSLRFRCDCGGLFRLGDAGAQFDPTAIETAEPSLLRYRHALPSHLHDPLDAISLGEGFTKTIRLAPDDPSVLLKMDHLMPTMSFKDRGAVLLVAAAMAAGAKRIVQDSSGNAGHAVAVYAARAGLPCEIFVPERTSPQKIEWMEIAQAKVRVIRGSREETADATLAAATEPATFYASHVYNPLFHEGTKTFVYELFEQLDGALPDHFVIPVGNGSLLLGVALALKELHAAGLLSDRPRIVAVQADQCAPIAAAFAAGREAVEPVRNLGTAAEGIAIAHPARGAEILAVLRAFDGCVLTAAENAIHDQHERLAAAGLHVEFTTAATFAAFAAHRDKLPGTSVLPICGAGIKSRS
jgi:threonine synthase